MGHVTVRYIVDDVDAAIVFYTHHLGFRVEMHPTAGFAAVSRGDLRLLLSAPQPAAGGLEPEPGGWNRIQLEIHDLTVQVDRLRKAGVVFRGDVLTGAGGRQALIEDPAGNLIELLQPSQ